ncbi:c-type cytochrome [Oxalobacteraceae bacterium A2-2]
MSIGIPSLRALVAALLLSLSASAAPAAGGADGAGPMARLAAPPVPPGARLAATCAACHGTAGATVGGVLPPLAGQAQDALLASLRAYQDGSRGGTIMPQIARGYSDEQLRLLAAYFAAQPREAAR